MRLKDLIESGLVKDDHQIIVSQRITVKSIPRITKSIAEAGGISS